MTWRRSSYCNSGSCLHAWPGHRTVWLRDSAGAVLVVEHADWRELLAHLTTTH